MHQRQAAGQRAGIVRHLRLRQPPLQRAAGGHPAGSSLLGLAPCGRARAVGTCSGVKHDHSVACGCDNGRTALHPGTNTGCLQGMQQGKGLPLEAATRQGVPACSPCSLSTNQKPAVRSTASFCAVSVAQMGCRKRSCQSQGSSAATQAGLPMSHVDCTKRRAARGAWIGHPVQLCVCSRCCSGIYARANIYGVCCGIECVKLQKKGRQAGSGWDGKQPGGRLLSSGTSTDLGVGKVAWVVSAEDGCVVPQPQGGQLRGAETQGTMCQLGFKYSMACRRAAVQASRHWRGGRQADRQAGRLAPYVAVGPEALAQRGARLEVVVVHLAQGRLRGRPLRDHGSCQGVPALGKGQRGGGGEHHKLAGVDCRRRGGRGRQREASGHGAAWSWHASWRWARRLA